MPGCREAAALITFSNPSNDRSDLASFCWGINVGLSYQGRSDGTLCFPVGVTREQADRAVVQYIDGQPSRMNENFVPFAIEALQAVQDLIPRNELTLSSSEAHLWCCLVRTDASRRAKELRSPQSEAADVTDPPQAAAVESHRYRERFARHITQLRSQDWHSRGGTKFEARIKELVEVEVMFNPVASVVGYIKAGKLRAL